MNVIANSARRTLIKVGKSIPFIVCGLVLVCYGENLYAIFFDKIIFYGDYAILDTPISYAIATKIEYNLLVVILILIISYAIETCIWNKLASFYLLVQLIEKYYIESCELEYSTIYTIILINMLLSAFFVYKGLKLIH